MRTPDCRRKTETRRWKGPRPRPAPPPRDDIAELVAALEELAREGEAPPPYEQYLVIPGLPDGSEHRVELTDADIIEMLELF
ncbi:MAG TPA: hypothetical protein VKN99_01605 [Polyangia bacterium]|nr:hypothetical protein [Polyangia bacterium]